MPLPRPRSLLAVTAAMTLLLTACATGEEEGADGPVTIDGGQPENPPIPGNTNEVYGGDILDAIFSKLVRYDPASAEPENDIAEPIETDDSQTFTITIRDDWTFHDGTELEARHFEDSWNDSSSSPHGFVTSYSF